MGKTAGRWTARQATLAPAKPNPFTLLFTIAAVMFATVGLCPDVAAAQATQEPNRSRLDVAETFLRTEVERAGFPGGSFAFLQDGQVARVGAFGVRDLKSGEPVTSETQYSVASITKPFTALAVLRLRDRGLIDLDAPVSRYLPWFALSTPEATRAVTVRHLLQHTTGLPTNAHAVVWDDEGRIRPSLEAGVRALSHVSLRSAPGERFEYSNMNFAVLGVLAETVSGENFEELLHREVFLPARAPTTYVGTRMVRDDHARTYIPSWGTLGEGPLTPGRYLAPASSAWSNASEMAQLGVALLGEGPAGDFAAYVDESRRAAVATGWSEEVGYGLGFAHAHLPGGATAAGHLGTASHSSALWIVPEEGLGLVLLVGGYSPARTRAIAEGTLHALRGNDVTPLAGPSDLEMLLWVSRGMILATILSLLLLATLLVSVATRLRRGWPPFSPGSAVKATVLTALAPTLWWFGLDGVRQIWHALPAPTGFGMGPMQGYPEEVATALAGAAVTATAWAIYALYSIARASRRTGETRPS